MAATVQTGGILISHVTAGAATASVTLEAPATGQVTKILWVACYAAGATIADFEIQKNDGTTICRIGGVGTGILNQPHVFGSADEPRGGVVGFSGDQTKVVVTTTGGTTTKVTVAYIFIPA